jgi:hypothetical protein
MQIKTCPRCGAKWINNQLYWATGKEGKEEDLAGLVCNTIDDPNCINAKKGDETGQTWESRQGLMNESEKRIKGEFPSKNS